MHEDKELKEAIKFTFTADQLQVLGQQLARECQEVYNLERKKKLDNTEMTAQIKAANDKAETTTTKINNGYEMRDVVVVAVLNKPTSGKKSIIRTDTNEPIRVESMTLEEMQQDFDFDRLMQAEDDREEG